MRAFRLLPGPIALLLACSGAPAPVQAGEDVVIYRCTDAGGRLTLRDSPCAKGERQETRSMLRPKDAPPIARTPPPPPVAAPPPVTQFVVVHPPRPLYECVTPDNTRYLSDTPEGNPRLVPLWTVGVPMQNQIAVYEPGRLNVSVNDGHLSGSYQSGGYTNVLLPGPGAVGVNGAWIRDTCHALPQTEVCARLRDRRDEVRRRFVIAQPSERSALGREERGIEARLEQDCR